MNEYRQTAIKTFISLAITSVFSGAIGAITVAFGAYLLLLSVDARVSAQESHNTEQDAFIQITLPETYVRKDVQIETNKRIEGKVDLLLENFNLEYKE